MARDLKIMRDGVCNFSHNGNTATVSGINRLCQKFVMELLTKKGSMRFLPKRGCSFLNRLWTRVNTEMAVLLSFTLATRQIKKLFRDENAQLRPAEQFADAKLITVIVEGDSIVLEIDVRNRAGQVARIKTPKIPLYEATA